VPDHEGECEVLTGIENVVPARVLNQDFSDVADRLVVSVRQYDISTPNLELGHILAEGDVKDPVKSLLGQPGLVQGQLADVS